MYIHCYNFPLFLIAMGRFLFEISLNILLISSGFELRFADFLLCATRLCSDFSHYVNERVPLIFQGINEVQVRHFGAGQEENV